MSDEPRDKYIGPMLPSSSSVTKVEKQCLGPVLSTDSVTIGPALPANFDSNNVNDDSDSHDGDDSEEDFGPALPPGFDNSSNSDRQFGPSLPDNFSQNENYEDDESEDIFGPVPEGQDDLNHQYDVSKRKYKSDEKASKREKWMLEPPKVLKKALQTTTSVTKFNQKSSKKDIVLTNEEKLELESVAEREGKMKEFLDKYEKNNKREVTLLAQHCKDMNKTKKTKHSNVERREFDRDKDLNVPRMDGKMKKSFIKDASTNFSSRFSSGKFEKFL